MSNIYFFLIAFAVSIFLMPMLKKISFKYRLYDEPGQDRLKIHPNPISYLGGVGIFIALCASIIASIVFNKISTVYGLGIMLASTIIIILGLWDDWKWKKEASRPVLKLFYQLASTFAIILLLAQIGIEFNFASSALLAALIASFYIVGAMNAMNMEDGMDGLAGGLSVISLAGFAIISLSEQNIFAVFFSIALAGAILGFLVHNWHPASIFMGDNGSHFLGFSLAILAIMLSANPLTDFNKFLGPILIIGLLVLDTVWAITRRLISGKSIFMGDRGHLYDRINSKGLGIPATVLLCWIIQLIIVTMGVLVYN